VRSPQRFVSVVYSSLHKLQLVISKISQIIDVKAQLRNGRLPRLGYFHDTASSFHSFQVAPEGDYYSLAHSGTPFAIFAKKMCSDIHAILDGRHVRFQAYIGNREWKEALKAWQKERNFTILTSEINIYGSMQDAGVIGNILSQAGTFLQQPRYGLDKVVYYNPHYFQVPGFSDTHSFNTPIMLIDDTNPSSNLTIQQEAQSTPSVEVSSILNSLSHHNDLQERIADRRIRSPLLP
jgi:SWI/SNF-related matrix-associated actin-dependent regulator of chromatin subfamily A3